MWCFIFGLIVGIFIGILTGAFMAAMHSSNWENRK